MENKDYDTSVSGLTALKEGNLLLTDEEILKTIKARYPLVMNQLDIGLHSNFLRDLVQAQLSKDQKHYSGYLSPGEVEAKIEEAKKAELDKLTVISPEEMRKINDTMPSEAKYGEVFLAIRDAQLNHTKKEFEEMLK